MQSGKRVLLRAEGIGKDYFDNVVLSDVSFELKAGEIMGLVGENGAGKSTLMNILFGMNVIHATGGYKGNFYIDGEAAHFQSPFDALDAGIGMVHQEFSLIPGFSAAENIVLNRESMDYNKLVELFGPRFQTLNRAGITERAKNAIGKLSVNIKPETHISEMPVAHKQFVEIAREIDRENTKLLVFDEPTAVLTESEARILVESIRNLADLGIGVIFISHRLQEVLDLCDKVLVLRDGRVIQEAPAKDTSIKQIAGWMMNREMGEGMTRRHRNLEPAEAPFLKVRNLWVDMPGEFACDISFEVRRGEIFGIGGLAGQGKLAVANGVMGLFDAGGSVELDGEDLPLNNTKSVLSRGVSFVSEDRRGVGLLLEEGIDRNITFGAMSTGNGFTKPLLGGAIRLQDKRAMRECAEEYIDALAVRCVGPSQRVMELSGGNQQKVCLAKAFAMRPKLLFVAEPTRGIDVGAKQIVLNTLQKYNEEHGATIVIISSELEELRAVCDRIAVVNEGFIAGILPATASADEFGLLMTNSISEEREGVTI